MVPSLLFLSPSESSALAIENMNFYKENKKCKDGAKIQFCTVFALCAKTAQDYLRKLRLAPSIKHKVLRCAATKTTLLLSPQSFEDWQGFSLCRPYIGINSCFLFFKKGPQFQITSKSRENTTSTLLRRCIL